MSETPQSTQHAEGSGIAQAQGPGAIATVITNIFRGSTAEQRALRNRHAMLQLVRNFWVKGVLEQSLHGAAMIELGLEERGDAVERPWDMMLQTPGQPNRSLLPGTKIVDVFDEMNRALLILGEPGSGKTTMLLELARGTVARAEEDPTQPIPVVFNLSSWTDKPRTGRLRWIKQLIGKWRPDDKQPLSDWLVDELQAKYNIPKTIARPWVENGDLLLLLDGLDEVEREQRDACVEAINAFRQEHGLAPLVVCSRTARYEALTARLNLPDAVLLQPLTPEQIDQYLEGAGTELLAVHGTLRHDPTLRELAQTPLMLSVMTLAYRGMSIEDLGSLDSIKARRKHVFDAYVQRMFERRGAERLFSPEQTVRWLAWLAQKMLQQAQTLFLIERMEPSWLRTRAQRWLYVIAWSLMCGPIIGLVFGLCAGLVFDPVFGLTRGLVGGLVGGLIFGLVAGPTKIEPTGVLKWSWEEGGEGLIGGLVSAGMETGTIPEQGIRQSLRNAVIAGLIGGLVGGLIFGMVAGSIGGLVFGLSVGLILGLHCGGYAVIQHHTLRFILCRSRYIPWNYARFLDYATERIFLRKVGGGYIFVHRLLMEYFASLVDNRTLTTTKEVTQ